MTIRLHLLSDIVTRDRIERRELPWDGVATVRRLMATHRLASWGHAPNLAASIEGRRLAVDEWDQVLADGVDLVIAPDPQGLELLATLALSLLAAGLNFIAAKQISLPANALDPGVRGDQSSQSNSWDRMATEYRPGFPVPIALGEGDLPGTAIFVDLNASSGGTNIGPNEELRVILALCEGPIDSIGGIRGDQDDLGVTEFQPHLPGQPLTTLPIPADIRVDGNRLDPTLTPTLQGQPGFQVWRGTPNARVYLRMGGLSQAPLPAVGPRWGLAAFSGSRQTEIVELDLGEDGSSAVYTVSDSDEISNVSCIVSFQAGLYDLTNSGLPPQPASVSFDLSWRPVGSATWSAPVRRVVTEASQSPFAVSLALTVNALGPIEVQMRRVSAAGGSGVSDRARWRQITFGFPQQFAYPRTALLGLVLQAGENATGSRAQFQVRGRWMTVPVWDASINGGQPSTTRYWDLPASPDPYAGIWTYPPGRNPAWLLAAFLLHPGGLGQFVPSANIDWPALRNWADFCDQDVAVNGVDEALCELFFVLDSSTPAWEIVARICQAGRATPVLVGAKISVVYRYRDAHGRGTNSVPAKTRTHLVSTANVSALSIDFQDTFARPAVITAEFQNKDKDYAQDVIDVHDPRGGHQDPATLRPVQFRKQAVRMHGIARPSQAVREALFMHAANALVDHSISFEIGREALAAQVGDVVGVCHDVLRPFDTDCFALRTTAESAAVAEIRLNRALTLAVGKTYAVIVRQTDGTIAERQVTSAAGSYAAGDLLTIQTAISCRRGAVACFGEQGRIIVDYEISSITLAQSLKRQVRADRWVPAVHDVIDVGDLLSTDGGLLAGPSGGLPSSFDLQDDITDAAVTDLAVRTLPGRDCEISWQRPDDLVTEVQVFARLLGSTQWMVLGRTTGNRVRTRLAIGESYEISVAMADRFGRFQPPGLGTMATVQIEEFPAANPPNVSGLLLEQGQRGIVLRWDPQQDAECYEVRLVGGDWHAWLGTPVLAVVQDCQCTIDVPGFWDESTPVVFGVAALSRDGLRSLAVAEIDWTPAAPAGLWEIDDLVPDPGHVDFESANLSVALASSNLAITAPAAAIDANPEGPGSGSMQSQVWDVGYDVDAWIAPYWESRAHRAMLVGATAAKVGSGESAWTLVAGRPASERSPGIDVERRVGDAADVSRERIGAQVGEAGTAASVRVYLRTARTGESITAKPWSQVQGARKITHRYVQWRVEVDWISDGSVSVDVRRLRLRRYA